MASSTHSTGRCLPIVLASYELVCSKYAGPGVGKAVRSSLQATVGPGQADVYGHTSGDTARAAAEGLAGRFGL